MKISKFYEEKKKFVWYLVRQCVKMFDLDFEGFFPLKTRNVS